ncbi:MAG: histidine kinase [Bacteroidota bacterium]
MIKSAGIAFLLEPQRQGPRLLRHLIFWLLFVAYNVATWGAYQDDVSQPIFSEFAYLPAKILMTYLAMYYLIPRYLLPRHYRAFFWGLLAGLIFFGLWNRLITYYVIYPRYYPEAVGSGFWAIKVFFEITILVNITTLGTTVKLLQHWYKNERSRQQLAQEKTAAELQLLKSQVHPHFLFNTLNNLYALTLEASPQAPDMVLKLSALLNYMLYECNQPQVDLAKEVRYLEDYISLEKLRYGENLALAYECSGELSDKSIAPLLLLPFVENAFKHGASQATEEPWIRLNLWVDETTLHLQVENSRVETEATRTATDYAEGIGLKNVQRRLDLLYPDSYELSIREDASFFVYLKLQLTSAAA